MGERGRLGLEMEEPEGMREGGSEIGEGKGWIGREGRRGVRTVETRKGEEDGR